MVFGLLVYALGMIIIRLQMTQTAYVFEETKRMERSLHEEQMRLKVRIAQSLQEHKAWLQDFREPDPRQVIRMPEGVREP